MSKGFIFSSLLLTILFFSTSAVPKPRSAGIRSRAKIAIVNIYTVLKNSGMARELEQELAEAVAAKKKAVGIEQLAFDALTREMLREGVPPTAADRTARLTRLERAEEALEQFKQRQADELNQLNDRLNDAMIEQISAKAKIYADQHKLSLVLGHNGHVLYAKEGMDGTADILAMFATEEASP